MICGIYEFDYIINNMNNCSFFVTELDGLVWVQDTKAEHADRHCDLASAVIGVISC